MSTVPVNPPLSVTVIPGSLTLGLKPGDVTFTIYVPGISGVYAAPVPTETVGEGTSLNHSKVTDSPPLYTAVSGSPVLPVPVMSTAPVRVSRTGSPIIIIFSLVLPVEGSVAFILYVPGSIGVNGLSVETETKLPEPAGSSLNHSYSSPATFTISPEPGVYVIVSSTPATASPAGLLVKVPVSSPGNVTVKLSSITFPVTGSVILTVYVPGSVGVNGTVVETKLPGGGVSLYISI